jgi:hypothetical protein
MTAETLSAVAGVVLSLAFSYVPGVREWFEALDATRKRLIMALSLAIVSAGVVALSCWNIMPLVTCNQGGVVALVTAFIAALVANQSAYLITPKARRPQK